MLISTSMLPVVRRQRVYAFVLAASFEVQLGRWHDKPIGPHPKAMYQVAFLPEQFGKVLPWLMLNRDGLDILVHPETGDDVGDHTDRSLWLGEKLELNIEFLRASLNNLIRLCSRHASPRSLSIAQS